MQLVSIHFSTASFTFFDTPTICMPGVLIKLRWALLVSPIKFYEAKQHILTPFSSVGGLCAESFRNFKTHMSWRDSVATFTSSLMKLHPVTPEKRPVSLSLFGHCGAVPIQRRGIPSYESLHSQVITADIKNKQLSYCWDSSRYILVIGKSLVSAHCDARLSDNQ